MSDLISRKKVLALPRNKVRSLRTHEVVEETINVTDIEHLSSAQPDNQTNLCDSCDCSYPDCPSKYDDVIFGNGIGNDNICACNKYKPSAQPERKKGKWIRNDNGTYSCSLCQSWIPEEQYYYARFCLYCGADMRGGDATPGSVSGEVRRMSELCPRGIKCPCFCCPETDCEKYETEPPEWIKILLKDNSLGDALIKIAEEMNNEEKAVN